MKVIYCDMKNLTILFCFYCASKSRRLYIKSCFKSLFQGTDLNKIPVVVLDGSPVDEVEKNRLIFKSLDKIEYVVDSEINPIKRMAVNSHYIKSNYVLWLLEDCIFIQNTGSLLESLKNDILVLKNNKKLTTIQYPIINNQVFEKHNNIVKYNHIEFDKKNVFLCGGRLCYNRNIERSILPYLCNNLLLRSDFFSAHMQHYSKICSSHANAESSLFDSGILKMFKYSKYTRKLAEYLHKVIFNSVSITKIYVTETMRDLDVIHIGYASTEDNLVLNPNRGSGKGDEHGVITVIDNLEVFSNAQELKDIEFRRM
jgi:hypothetical protein